ncbi:MAG TPA: ABC-type transport auxiliary lipoprotein family protein [Burkholderiales bacterium]|nr:ABC-type transport auxiliary lipoprotein family protein [Burkholderiales bacterium]
MRALLVAGLLAVLAGCASREAPVHTYDLGVDAPRAQLPALRAVSVRAPMPYDSVEMFYRLAWRDAGEIAPFASSRWAAPPAELLRRQIVRALPGTAAAACALEVELQDFSQRFSAPDASEARIELRAALVTPERRIAAQSFRIAEAGAGASAASGSSAFARAAERAVDELAGWIARQPACAAP